MQETEIKNETQSSDALSDKVRRIFKTIQVVDGFQALKKLIDADKQPEFAKCNGKYICQTDDGCFEGETLEAAIALASEKL